MLVSLDQRERASADLVAALGGALHAAFILASRLGGSRRKRQFVACVSTLSCVSAVRLSGRGNERQFVARSLSRDPADAARFERLFEAVWRRGEELIDFPAAAKAAEPD
jgi:hypothetical protein